MPISPENKKLYPSDWKDIRQRILIRANDQCEFCKVNNYDVGVRIDGEFLPLYGGQKPGEMWSLSDTKQFKVIKIVLTIAHIYDMNPANCDDDNLKALCQRCHNKHDAKFRAENRKKNAAKQKNDRHERD